MIFDKFLGKVRERDKSVVSGSDGNSTAANITVNGESPDSSGNVALTTNQIPISPTLYEALRHVLFPSGWNPVTDGGITKDSRIDSIVMAFGLYLDGEAHENSKLVPAGTVIAYAGSHAPYGFIACNGAEVSRETYADLFAAIGTLYGEGDGSTTFNLPDLTDRVVQGSATAGTALAAGLPNISGTMTERAFVRESSGGNITLISQAGGAFKTSTTTFEANTVACELSSTKVTDPAVVSFDASKSNVIYGNSTTVQPPALTMIYCIKY